MFAVYVLGFETWTSDLYDVVSFSALAYHYNKLNLIFKGKMSLIKFHNLHLFISQKVI